jgi:hypothetical protein
MPIDTTTALAANRAAIGLSCWTVPVTASKLFGIDISNDVSGKLYLRLGGTRDLALAAGTKGFQGDAKKLMLGIAAACDVADIVAVKLARKEGQISKLGTVLFIGASLGCLALGAKAATEETA